MLLQTETWHEITEIKTNKTGWNVIFLSKQSSSNHCNPVIKGFLLNCQWVETVKCGCLTKASRENHQSHILCSLGNRISRPTAGQLGFWMLKLGKSGISQITPGMVELAPKSRIIPPKAGTLAPLHYFPIQCSTVICTSVSQKQS